MPGKADANRAIRVGDQEHSRSVVSRELGIAWRFEVAVGRGHGGDEAMKQLRWCFISLFEKTYLLQIGPRGPIARQALEQVYCGDRPAPRF